MTGVTRVVFDCNIFLQALMSPEGPAGRCMQLAMDGAVLLFISPTVLEELRGVTSRPKVTVKLKLAAERVREFLETIAIAATVIDRFPEPLVYAHDPDDAHYVNLALAADAKLIVSRDRDLLDLMDLSRPEAVEFQRRFPAIRILDPVRFLGEIEL